MEPYCSCHPTDRDTGYGCGRTEVSVRQLAHRIFRSAQWPIFAPHPAIMLQRKQTLYFLLAAICGVLTFFFPVDTFTRGDQTFEFRTTGLFLDDGTEVADAALKVPFAAVLGLLSALLLGLITLYRNRSRQARLAGILNLLLIAVQVFLFITDNSIRAYLEQGGRVVNRFGLSALLPLVMVLLVLLAIRGIRKDEALVRSMDRLR